MVYFSHTKKFFIKKACLTTHPKNIGDVIGNKKIVFFLPKRCFSLQTF